MWVLIPIKTFALAKTRLAESVSAPQRAALAERLAEIALRAALGASGVSRVVALSGDPAAQRLARSLGAEVMDEFALPKDFNVMLGAAFDTLERGGPSRLCYLASDLPDLTSHCLQHLIEAHQGGVSIGRAGRDGGTNALVFDAPRRFALAFGANSAQLHQRAAIAAGLAWRWLDIAGISNDLDTPDLASEQMARLLLQGAA